jgi:restriction endonuclease S subunit
MKTIIAKNNWLKDSDLRLDASFHLSDGVLASHILKTSKVKCESLKKLTTAVFMGPRFKRYYVSNPDNGVPFMGGSDMQKSSLSGLKLISKKMTKEIQQLYLKKDWILVTRSGTIGQSVFTNEDFEGKTATEDVIRIIADDTKIKAGYLFAYLSSKFGYALLTQSTYGAVIQHIEPHHLKNLPVPLLSDKKQQQIHDLIIDASTYRVEANRLLEEGKKIISDFLREDNIKSSHFPEVSINDIKKGQIRFDPPVHVSSAVQKINSLKNKGFTFKTIKELGLKTYRPGIFKRAYTTNEHGFPYIAGSESFQINPFKSCKYISKKRTPFLGELKLMTNEILLMCAGSSSVGKVKLITKEYEEFNSVGSQDIIRIYPSDVFSYAYVFAYLDLPIMFEYIKSFKYGSAIERLEPFHADDIPILIPDNSIIKEVDSKVKEYQNKVYLSFKYETQAIEIIENEISSWQK